MFILFTNLFLARPFRLENTLECYNLRGGQGGSTEVLAQSCASLPVRSICRHGKSSQGVFSSDDVFLNRISSRMNKFHRAKFQFANKAGHCGYTHGNTCR